MWEVIIFMCVCVCVWRGEDILDTDVATKKVLSVNFHHLISQIISKFSWYKLDGWHWLGKLIL